MRSRVPILLPALLLVGGLLLTGRGQGSAAAPAAPHWSQLRPDGALPAARDGHWMTYDSSTKTVVLFGGKGARSQYFNDLWTYTLHTDTWHELKPVGHLPPARFGHAIVYDAGAKEVLVFGGVVATTNRPADDLWAYSTARNSW